MSRVSLLLAFALLACSSNSGDAGPLAFHQLYQCYENGKDIGIAADNYYLKFIDSKTVLNTVSDETPAQIQSWFVRGNANVNAADYRFEGGQLIIDYDLSTYEGSVAGDDLSFVVTSYTGAQFETFPRNYRLLK